MSTARATLTACQHAFDCFCKHCCHYFGAVEAAIAVSQTAPKPLFI
jgi:hypothetical protein